MDDWKRGNNKPTPRSIARNKAKAAGETMYLYKCKVHGMEWHYVDGNACRECKREKYKVKNRIRKKTQEEQERVRYIQGWPV